MAAVTLANIPLFVVQLFIFGVQSGSTVLLSQYWGKQDMESINRIYGMALWLVMAVSSLCSVILLICPVEFLSLFGNDGRWWSWPPNMAGWRGCPMYSTPFQ